MPQEPCYANFIMLSTFSKSLPLFSQRFVNGMVYYGISMASDNLGGDMYRDFILTSLVEIPANILVVVLGNKYALFVIDFPDNSFYVAVRKKSYAAK